MSLSEHQECARRNAFEEIDGRLRLKRQDEIDDVC